MEAITLKLEKSILTEIDKKLVKHRYSTRTEFLRDAIRKQLSELDRDDFLETLSKLKGSSKRKTTDEELHNAREKAFEILDNKARLSP